ncbi:hypothetical protein ACFLVN_02115 [Chloroflexota bacterium]
MKKKVVAALSLVLALSFGFSPAYVYADEGPEQLTPGFWKQPQHVSSWVGYSPNDTVVSVFDKASGSLAEQTLLEALNFNGGKGSKGANKILMRAAVAALLNAEHPNIDYPLTSNEIINSINGVINPGDRETVIDLADMLDAYNNGES